MTREAAGRRYSWLVSLAVALGGFLMGFDASVISGVVGFIETEFRLTEIQLGWGVASLTLSATVSMMVCGPLADRYGRRRVLRIAALLFGLSAVASALAPNFLLLVVARMLGGLGVGAALIVAPMYIAEIAPADIRGRLVALNQLNIVVGISAAFFSNYLILQLGQSDTPWAGTLGLGVWNWRWMLGVEALPALVYFAALLLVPESPRWLGMQGRTREARMIMQRVHGAAGADRVLSALDATAEPGRPASAIPLSELFGTSMRRVLVIALVVAVVQQITGINAVFFYAPMIFEQSGIGTDAAFMQAVFVGLVNLAFTVAALLLIDRLGRRPLLLAGTAGVAVCMILLAWAFGSATYTLTDHALAALPAAVDGGALASLAGITFESDVAFKAAVAAAAGPETLAEYESLLVAAAIRADSGLILAGILGFVASFAVSLGPVMWVLFSELFPNRLRGLAISFVGLVNSSVSFLVQLLFPWEIANIGSAGTFLIYGLFAVAGFLIILRLMPETKGRSLEELEALLVDAPARLTPERGPSTRG
ncbi:sugar porter family MFS transporter [Lentisalinibacter orientalis]|uniref:sugar porter family MFS transporter n=1 Tax=Lentisalinibacter orientalis TaxID=2992241 RepID=UPI00386D22E7